MLTRVYVDTVAFLESLKRDERGVTAIEYAIVAVAIAAFVAIAFNAGDGNPLYDAIKGAFERVGDIIDGVGAEAGGTP